MLEELNIYREKKGTSTLLHTIHTNLGEMDHSAKNIEETFGLDDDFLEQKKKH